MKYLIPEKTALIIQDLQNDVITEGGAFAGSGANALIRGTWGAAPAGGITEVMKPANKCNGMTYDDNGDLNICEHSSSTVVRQAPGGTASISSMLPSRGSKYSRISMHSGSHVRLPG